MNAKLALSLASLGTASRAAMRIASALRGPDSEDLYLKGRFTTPIRVWALGGMEDYDRIGYTRKVAPRVVLTSKEACLELLSEANRLYRESHRVPWPGPNQHYIGHVCIALAAIAWLEGWKDEKFDRYFKED